MFIKQFGKTAGLVLLLALIQHTVFAQQKFSRLVWSDEFNGQGLPDSSKWSYDIGRGCPQNCGWGNNELEYYTSKRVANARQENGNLIIEARKEKWEDAGYTSARLVTANKGDWTYGRMEIRAQLPNGRGMWPAIWMLPTKWVYGGWPVSGEIDIMENVGYSPDSILGTVHTDAFNGMKGTQKSNAIVLKDAGAAFHVYAAEWSADKIEFSVDGKVYGTFVNNHSGVAAWPFDQAFHIILNIAVGGNWGGKFGVDDSIFPQRMLVDYVRVYQ